MVEMKTSYRLVMASKLIADGSRWTSHQYAVRADGSKCAIDDPSAARWDANGALVKVLYREFNNGPVYPWTPEMGAIFSRMEQALTFASSRLHGRFRGDFIKVNDTLGHAAIMQTFSRAIEDAERAGD